MRPLGRLSIPFDQRLWPKIDKQDSPKGCWVWVGSVDSSGYGQISHEGRMVKVHRLVYMREVGPIPEGTDLDHKCHIRLCCNPSHLHPVSRKENAENRVGPRKGSSSGIRGVRQRGKSWEGRVCHNGAYVYLGLFATTAEAEAAVVAKRNELFTNNLLDRKSA